MSAEVPQMIEIRRVLSDKHKTNTHSELETIEVKRIKSFRVWHKGEKDTDITGDMTILILHPEPGVPVTDNKPKTMLIEENYKSFRNRMSAYVGLREAPNEPVH